MNNVKKESYEDILPQLENQVLKELKSNLNLKINFIPSLIETNYYDFYHDVKGQNNGLFEFEKTKNPELRNVNERSFRFIENF